MNGDTGTHGTDARPFSRWHRHMEGPALALVVDDPAGGNPLEWRTLDVRTLPQRPDLLARLGAVVQSRLLADAAHAELEYPDAARIPEEVDGPQGEYASVPVVVPRLQRIGAGLPP
ncbi:MAG: hypothetical protein IPO66_06145 [Rhodanobacteraceae bacterium]|nr:hypothetical protein [Rhodanobacteraceae bacterium]